MVSLGLGAFILSVMGVVCKMGQGHHPSWGCPYWGPLFLQSWSSLMLPASRMRTDFMPVGRKKWRKQRVDRARIVILFERLHPAGPWLWSRCGRRGGGAALLAAGAEGGAGLLRAVPPPARRASITCRRPSSGEAVCLNGAGAGAGRVQVLKVDQKLQAPRRCRQGGRGLRHPADVSVSPHPSPRGPGRSPQIHTGADLLFYLFMYCFRASPRIFYPSPNKIFIKDSGSICFSLRCGSNPGFESNPAGC